MATSIMWGKQINAKYGTIKIAKREYIQFLLQTGRKKKDFLPIFMDKFPEIYEPPLLINELTPLSLVAT